MLVNVIINVIVGVIVSAVSSNQIGYWLLIIN